MNCDIIWSVGVFTATWTTILMYPQQTLEDMCSNNATIKHLKVTRPQENASSVMITFKGYSKMFNLCL